MTRTAGTSLERAGDMRLDLGTHRQSMHDMLVDCIPCPDRLVAHRRLVLSRCPALSQTLPLVLSNPSSVAGGITKPLAWALRRRGSKQWPGPWGEERMMYRRIMVVTGEQAWSDVPLQYAI